MHIIDGDFFKASGNQRLMLHIQNFIKKHYQQIIQKLFPVHFLIYLRTS